MAGAKVECTQMTFQVRRAGPPDAEAIAEAHRESIASIGPRFYPADLVEEWGARIEREMYCRAMNEGEVFFIALGPLDGRPVVLGFSSHHIDDGEHGVAVYVRGRAARQGVGSALIAAAEASAVATGATRITIDSSLAAVEFYRAHGFRETGRGDHRLRSGSLMPCVFMRKDLERSVRL
jgi:putative acetyltransferase